MQDLVPHPDMDLSKLQIGDTLIVTQTDIINLGLRGWNEFRLTVHKALLKSGLGFEVREYPEDLSWRLTIKDQ